MPTFKRGDIVRVPFPYTDRDVRQYRPALIVSCRPLGDGGRLCWVVMITSAEHRRWPRDVDMGGLHEAAGLRAPSLVRTAKIATVETDRIERLGHLPESLLQQVEAEMVETLGRRAERDEL